MTMPITRETFLDFLVTAKQHTYAAQGGENAVSPPLLPGSRQLEYQQGDLLYRDIYFGNDYFVGQETVYYENGPVWSMNYAGGKLRTADIQVAAQKIYTFLQTALSHVSQTFPYRGPQTFSQLDFAYSNEIHGDIDRFWGRETVTYQGSAVYQLHYSGGMLQ